MTCIRCEANATAVRQVDDKHLLAGRVARRHHKLQGAVVEQVEVALDFQDIQLANVAIVVLAINRAGPGIGS